VTAVKSSVLLIVSGPSGSLIPELLSVENRGQVNPVPGGVRLVALIHYPSCADSFKPSLNFSCNFVVIYASGDHIESRILDVLNAFRRVNGANF
jgi:hypothetical protein